jgi:hypothetical protein
MNTKNPILVGAIAFVVGWAIGLFVFGWGIWPVQYQGATAFDLSPEAQQHAVRASAELYSYNRDAAMAQQSLGPWNGTTVACQMATQTADPAEAQKLIDVATAVNGTGCADTPADTPATEDAGGSPFATILLLGLLLLLIVGAIMVLRNRRNDMLDSDGDGLPDTVFGTKPDEGPESGDDVAFNAVPIAKFQTTYNHGHESFDDSFSIEKSDGTFLGECGVSIAESIGSDSPKNVAAIEVWLFDKNDIRTITRVVMSEHAYYDEAMKAKLAPKGDPALAKENEVVVLETAALIINVELKGLEYGDSESMPPESYFERVTFELSAWAKEDGNGGNASASDGADGALEFDA